MWPQLAAPARARGLRSSPAAPGSPGSAAGAPAPARGWPGRFIHRGPGWKAPGRPSANKQMAATSLANAVPETPARDSSTHATDGRSRKHDVLTEKKKKKKSQPEKHRLKDTVHVKFQTRQNQTKSVRDTLGRPSREESRQPLITKAGVLDTSREGPGAVIGKGPGGGALGGRQHSWGGFLT